MFKLEIEIGNDAFCNPDGDPSPGLEIARILGEIQSVLLSGNPPDTGAVRDINGNRVGSWELTS